ncbi:hypothetical protein KDW_21610 [Dictyobacter vulcani]|uniref:Uncharacterized protein n=1 Tax=Dictyobacter vulcani TaxID=2607529 RepID=A0A5J4KPF8_9CHLR|nr:hypothetical protein KDW_21610 [Dictyobacter vulcani]
MVGVKEQRNGQAGKSVAELAKDEETTPVGASFVGLASTKRYYPVETPLDQLSEIDGKPVDVIYFTSESEAQAQVLPRPHCNVCSGGMTIWLVSSTYIEDI